MVKREGEGQRARGKRTEDGGLRTESKVLPLPGLSC